MTERTFEGLWADLAPVGRDKHSGGYRRFAWSREDSMLREWFDGECEALGLDVVEDRAGNQWAWWGEPDRTPGVATGSHLDSVPDGGVASSSARREPPGPLPGVSSLISSPSALHRTGAVSGRSPTGVRCPGTA